VESNPHGVGVRQISQCGVLSGMRSVPSAVADGSQRWQPRIVDCELALYPKIIESSGAVYSLCKTVNRSETTVINVATTGRECNTSASCS